MQRVTKMILYHGSGSCWSSSRVLDYSTSEHTSTGSAREEDKEKDSEQKGR